MSEGGRFEDSVAVMFKGQTQRSGAASCGSRFNSVSQLTKAAEARHS